MYKAKTTEQFVQEANIVHGNKYDYSETNYVDAKTKVKIICPKHGSFWQVPNNHLRKHGCLQCALENRPKNEKIPFSLPLTTDVFLKRAKKVHGNKYDYSKANYVNTKTKVCIICPEHGEFWQTPDKHINRIQGCPYCTHLNSTYEQYLYDKLVAVFGVDDIERQYCKDKRYPFKCDFYIKSKDLFIEVNGFWTHGEHWFDKDSVDDTKVLKEWVYHSENGDSYYKEAIKTWTIRDVKKRRKACTNNLNYVVFWGIINNKHHYYDEVDRWFKKGCPIRKDWAA